MGVRHPEKGTSTMAKRTGTLVGIKERSHARALTELACEVTPAGEALLLVHVIELPDNTPLDAPLLASDRAAHQILRVAAQVAQKHGRKATTRSLRAHHAGKALLEELKDGKIALAVLGFHHGRNLRELLAGTTHQYLARRAPCRLLLDIPPRK